MSYILDAINKSDHERKIRQGPNLAEAYQSERHRHNQARFWPVVTALLVLIVLGGLLGGVYFSAAIWKWPWGLSMGTAEAGYEKGAEVSSTPPFHTVLERWQLPDTLRRKLPPLEFSLHVYSELPQQRSIIINNRMMREGETLDRDLTLRAITEEGVIMRYQTEYFRVRIVENWEE